MNIVLISKTDFTVSQYANVSNIAYASNNITITYGGNTVTVSLDDYHISILW